METYNIDKHGTTFLLFYGYTVAQWAGKMNKILCCDWQFKWGYLVFSGLPNGPIYTGDGWPVWDELGHRMVACLIICLCINTGKQTSSIHTSYRDSLSCETNHCGKLVKTDDPSACRYLYTCRQIFRRATVLWAS